MIDDGGGVVAADDAVGFLLEVWRHLPGGVDEFCRDVFEGGEEVFHEGAVGVEFFGLEDGIHDAEVGGGVGAGGGGPLPSTDVAGLVVVDEGLHEEAFAEDPVGVEVFCEEHGGDHAEAVVHEAGGAELDHGGVDEGVAGAGFFPGGEEGGVVFPGDVAVVALEGEGDGAREVEEDHAVEVAPDEFADEGGDAFVGEAGLVGSDGGGHGVAEGEGAGVEVSGEARGALVLDGEGGEVAGLAVGEDGARAESLEEFRGGAFAGN